MRDVFIAIGSNLGDRLQNLARARTAMQRMGISIEARSSIYETDPWGPVKQGRYLNQVVRARTRLAPYPLLATLRRIEKTLGRDRATEQRFGPRTMDLDLLIYGNRSLRTPVLQVPHPRMMQRAFVLVPLAEIAPNLILNGVPVRGALGRLDSTGVTRV